MKEDQKFDEDLPIKENKLRMSMDDVMDSGEIAIYNQSGELRMTKVSSKKHLNNENILFEKDPGSKLSVSLNNSEDFDLPKENGYNNEDWEEIAENKKESHSPLKKKNFGRFR